MSHTISDPEAVGLSAERLARIGPAMQAYVDHRRHAGISTMIARRGRVVHAEQVGLRDREAGLPMAADTIFRIYSMTKPVVAVALMVLYEEGRFQLLDPVAKYLPAFGKVRVLAADGGLERPARPIQVRDLLTHTSGLTYDFLEDSPVCALYRQARILNDMGRSLGDMVAEIARLPLAFHPGARWQYSVGLDVAGHLVEILSGLPLDQFLRQRIFAPLGMADTGFGVPPAQRGRLAAMYGLPDLTAEGMTVRAIYDAWRAGFHQRLDLAQTSPVDRPDLARGGGGLFSTIGDYMRFALMLCNGGALDGARILGRKTVALMHLNHLPPELLPYELAGVIATGYGFGLGSNVVLDVAATGMLGSVGTFGWSGAARAGFWVDPHEQLVGVLMTQFMLGVDRPDYDLHVLAYQALVD